MLFALAPIAGHHLRDAVVGLAGAVVGGILLHAFTRQGHTSPSFVVELLVAFVGAVVLLTISRLLSGGRVGRRRYF